jgi:hypothetical protein
MIYSSIDVREEGEEMKCCKKCGKNLEEERYIFPTIQLKQFYCENCHDPGFFTQGIPTNSKKGIEILNK